MNTTTQSPASFAVGDLVRFATTHATVRHGVCFKRGRVEAVHPTFAGPRYDVLVPLDNTLWQSIAPTHLMKDPIAPGIATTPGSPSHEV